MIDVKATGCNIKQMIKARNIDLTEISNACGFTTNQPIYKWFWGYNLPTIDNLVILSDVLGCTLDEIIISRRNEVTE